MTQTRTEIVVGFFVLVGMACLGYLALKLGKLEVLGNSGYTVYADFPSVAGLKIGDPVEIAGVKIGRVEVMGLADDRARLQLRILIGDKFVLITPGASDKIIPPGGKIRETDSPPDIVDLIGKIVGGDLTSKGEKKDEGQK